MPTASGLYHGWTGVSFASTTLPKITNVQFNQGGQLTPFFGDAALYPQVVMAHSGKVTVTVHSGAEGLLMGIAFGSTGAFAATHKDAIVGGISYAMANAMAGACTGGGQYGSYGTAQLTIEGFSSDGTTNPLSVTVT